MADPDIVMVRSLGAGRAEAVAIDSSDGLVERCRPAF